jgi:cold shock protein
VPTGRVKWYDAGKGFGFVTSDEGGDVFLPKGALPAGVTDLKSGQRVEFGVPSVAELRRRPPEELHGLVEDMIKVLEAKIQPDLRRGRFPDRKTAQTVAQLVHAVASELEV